MASMSGQKSTPMSRADRDKYPCPRCGHVRSISGATVEQAKNRLCRDCRYVEPLWPDILGGVA